MSKIKRPTLNALLQEKVGMDRLVFARVLNISVHTLDSWWRHNRLVLRLLLAGYQQEVRKDVNKDTAKGSDQVE